MRQIEKIETKVTKILVSGLKYFTCERSYCTLKKLKLEIVQDALRVWFLQKNKK